MYDNTKFTWIFEITHCAQCVWRHTWSWTPDMAARINEWYDISCRSLSLNFISPKTKIIRFSRLEKQSSSSPNFEFWFQHLNFPVCLCVVFVSFDLWNLCLCLMFRPNRFCKILFKQLCLSLEIYHFCHYNFWTIFILVLTFFLLLILIPKSEKLFSI